MLLSGEDVNLGQIEAGPAWHYIKYAREQSVEDRERYAEAEIEAREAWRELWREPNPVPPGSGGRERTKKCHPWRIFNSGKGFH